MSCQVYVHLRVHAHERSISAHCSQFYSGQTRLFTAPSSALQRLTASYSGNAPSPPHKEGRHSNFISAPPHVPVHGGSDYSTREGKNDIQSTSKKHRQQEIAANRTAETHQRIGERSAHSPRFTPWSLPSSVSLADLSSLASNVAVHWLTLGAEAGANRSWFRL